MGGIYETFPLHFLHQKASTEYTSHVRERPSLCLQFEQGASQAKRPNHASPRRQSRRSGTTGLYRRAGERRQTWATDRTLRTQRYLVDSTFCESAFYGNPTRLDVEPGFHPATKLPALPAEGNGVVAIATSNGMPAAPIVSKVIHFSGYDWSVRNAASDRGGQPNSYDPSNVWTDKNGYLHLRMEEHDGLWTCAEVSLTRSLGYGSYIFVVQDTGHFGPSAALGLYTNDDFRTDDIPGELDIELSRWGIADSKNAQYVVQPFYVPENVSRFTAPAGVLTHMLRWESGRASFKTVRGSGMGSGAATISEHIFTSGVPTPAKETVHMGLYSYRLTKTSSQQPVEVVIEKFEFLP